MSAGKIMVPGDLEEASAFLASHSLSHRQAAKVTPGDSLRESCLIQAACGTSWFVKRADPALQREDMLYSLVEECALPAGLVRLIAPRRAALANDSVRIYAGFSDIPTLSDLLEQSEGYTPAVAERVGTIVATMHSCQHDLPATDPRIQEVKLRTYEAVNVVQYAERSGFEYEMFLAKAQGVSAELAALDAELLPRLILHGDLKADNVLVGEDIIQLIDWELWGLGDPMYDVGTLVGSIIAAWLDHVPSRPGRPMPEWFAGASVSSARLSSFVELLLTAYEAKAGFMSAVQEKLLWRSAGAFLLERGHVSNFVYGRFLLSTRLAMELGERLLCEPILGTEVFTPGRRSI